MNQTLPSHFTSTVRFHPTSPCQQLSPSQQNPFEWDSYSVLESPDQLHHPQIQPSLTPVLSSSLWHETQPASTLERQENSIIRKQNHHFADPSLLLLLSGIKLWQFAKRFHFSWTEPQDYAFVSATTTLMTTLLWHAWFVWGGAEDASVFQVLLAGLIPGAIVGGPLNALIYLIWHQPVLEETRPFVAKIANKLGLTQNSIPSLANSLGLPTHIYEDFEQRLTDAKQKAELVLEKTDVLELKSKQVTGDLCAEEKDLLLSKEKYISKISEERDVRKQSYQEAKNFFGLRLLSPQHYSYDTRYLAFLGSAVFTISALSSHYGWPQNTENTQALFAAFGAGLLFNSSVFYYFNILFLENLTQKVLRPALVFLLDFFPFKPRNLSGAMTTSNLDRYKQVFSGKHLTIEGYSLRLKKKIIEYQRRQSSLSMPEKNLLKEMEETHKIVVQIFNEVNDTLKKLGIVD